MNNRRYNARFLELVIAFTTASILLFAFANENNVSAQDIERSLDIERYKNEPYEIVNVYVDGKSIKDKIKSKIKHGQEGLDNAKFKNKNGWYNHIKVRVRNTSQNQIISISASLRLEHPNLESLLGLPISPIRNLNQEPLKPGEEIDLEVNERYINPIKEFLREKNADENVPTVRLTINHVFFTKTFQWSKGGFLRPDPNNPNKWNTVGTPPSPEIRQNIQQSNFRSSIFKPASFKSASYFNQEDPENCKNPQGGGGYAADPCPENGYYCKRIDWLFSDPGRFTRATVIDFCKDPATGSPEGCGGTLVAHQEYGFNPSCPDPCPDNDNDGYTICQNDCNDNNANINPGKPEDCYALGDENCNGKANEEERNCVECDEDGDGYDNINPPCYGADCDDDNDDIPARLEEYCRRLGGGTADYVNCDCNWGSPIILDVAGNGFLLTSAANGVKFDLDSNGQKEQRAWTRTQSDDAWLVLDRNGNNLIDNGQELFGNFTPQPPPPPGEQLNGFLALAEYDKSANGGNRNRVIDANDTIFSQLRLWQDINQNGISESSELHKLSELGLAELELDYKESKRTDEFGNQFRYRAKVKDVQGTQVSRWAWDVFLMQGTSTSRTVPANNYKLKGLIAKWNTLSTSDQPFSFIFSNLQYTNPIGRCGDNLSIKAIN